jgi:hypothetical protein
MSLQDLYDFREKYHEGYNKFRGYLLKVRDLDAPAIDINKLKSAPSPYQRASMREGEFAPILHGRIHDTAYLFGGDEGHPWESPHNLARVGRLKQYLLYAHRIILPDPIWYICQYFAFKDRKDDEYVARSRAALTNYLDFLYLIRDLIQTDIVSFYPQYEHTGGGFPQEIFEDQRFIEWFNTQTDSKSDIPVARLIHNRILELLFYCIRYDASCTIDNPRLKPVLESVLEFGQALGGRHIETKVDSVARKERNALKSLVTLPLPTAEKLELKEIIAVRREGDGFQRWRSYLQEGLLRIESKGLDSSALQKAVRESLAHGKQALEREFGQSSLLSKIKDDVGTFTVGAMAGWIVGDPSGGLATGAVSVGLNILKDFFVKRKDRESRKALLKHYTLIGED